MRRASIGRRREATVEGAKCCSFGGGAVTGSLVRAAPGSGDGGSGCGGLPHEASHIEGAGEDVPQDVGLGAVGSSVPGGTL